MKKIIAIFILLTSMAFAFVLDDCYKIFSYDADDVFMSAINAINSSSEYEISEIQSRNGYILFLRGSKYYLLTVTKRYSKQTEVKILPQNSDFSQGNIIATQIFAMIDTQLKKPMGLVK